MKYLYIIIILTFWIISYIIFNKSNINNTYNKNVKNNIILKTTNTISLIKNEIKNYNNDLYYYKIIIKNNKIILNQKILDKHCKNLKSIRCKKNYILN